MPADLKTIATDLKRVLETRGIIELGGESADNQEEAREWLAAIEAAAEEIEFMTAFLDFRRALPRAEVKHQPSEWPGPDDPWFIVDDERELGNGATRMLALQDAITRQNIPF